MNSPTAPTDLPSVSEVRILLVDDESADLQALEAILDGPGRRLVRAVSAEQALRLLLEGDFAVVLLDLDLPGLDGFQTARLIRSRERSRDTPVIFLKAPNGSDFPLAEAYKLGAVDYLVRPLIPEILQAKVAVFAELFEKTSRLQRQAEQLLRAERERAERAALVQYAVAGALAEATDLSTALPAVLQVACESLGWDAAGLWAVDREVTALNCAAFWASPDAQGAEFEADSRRRAFQPCQELPGQVWSGGESSWIEDFAAGVSFPRLRPGLGTDMRAACALPIRVGPEVVGVLEFFSRTVRPRDEGMMRALAAVGSQVGQTLERRRAEAELRRSEARFAGFMRHLPGLAWIKDLEGRYVYANDAAQRAFCTPREELYGRTDDEVFPTQTAAQFRKNDLQALVGGVVRVVETLEHEDGIHHSLVSKFAIPGPGGEPDLVGGVAFDITDRLKAEEALREADRRKDAFLAMLAHELRGPLAPLTNALQLLQMQAEDPAVVGQIRELAERQVRQIVRLVDDLLDVSRIAQGKLRLVKERVDAARVVAQAVETTRHLLEARRHELNILLPREPLELEVDAARLVQILSNLLTNAARYTPEGGKVWISAGRDGCDVTFRVRDTGIGLTPEVLPHVFELFAQVRQGAQGGLGVGLALVRGLAELHGGSVQACSDGPGQGSEFIVRLPDSSQRRTETSRLRPENAASGPSRRVLVVDDNVDAAESMALVLRLRGHQCLVANDGISALELARLYNPEVVLLDLGLPGGLDGYQVAERFRQERVANLLIIALTGYGQEEDRRRATEAGFDHFLVKPVETQSLERLLAAPPATTAAPRPVSLPLGS